MKPWRDILIVTVGSSPQVVTETLFALAKRKGNPIVPTKIICAITKGVVAAFGPEFDAAVERLKNQLNVRRDWIRSDQLWRDARCGLFVEFPSYQNGDPVADIRSDNDAVRFGDFISEIVRTETLDEGSRLHLSLSGGRRTMSFHGGAAMSLFGRPQDQLSHVLVQPADFEGCRDFWFPTNRKVLVRHKDGRTLDASTAKIGLTLIPFVRVRDRLHPRLLTHNLDYAAHVAQANASLGNVPLFLELTTSERRVRVGDLVDFTLSNTEFSLYQLMAEWRRNGNTGAGPSGIGDAHAGWLTAQMFKQPEKFRPNPVQRFIQIYTDTFKTGIDRANNMLNSVTAVPKNEKQRKDNERNFAQWKARLVSKLQERLEQDDIADRFGAPRSPVKVKSKNLGTSNNRVVFGLRLEPREILIRDD